MTDVASRELRNQTRSLLDRVAAGERLTITVDGRRVAELVPASARPRFMPKQRFVAEVLANQADAALHDELMHIRGSETTDDLPFE